MVLMMPLILQEKGGDLIQSRGAKWFPGALSNDSYPSSADSLTTISVPGQMFYPPANPPLQGHIPQFAHNLHLNQGFPGDMASGDLGHARHYSNGSHHQADIPSTSGRWGSLKLSVGYKSGRHGRSLPEGLNTMLIREIQENHQGFFGFDTTNSRKRCQNN